jgi:hypothetical protein
MLVYQRVAPLWDILGCEGFPDSIANGKTTADVLLEQRLQKLNTVFAGGFSYDPAIETIIICTIK